ncbi:RCC1 domain-containing protein RUG3, mitochondrial isoform X1 [Dioscorea cayenensis subsp. rotundata]|uniref:RCC1 domain-containing protein RUG3, mitochondrial isoform X1 n=1 Tax=Dioscorea cayennensis subsp. rotundata TaxID=55577 RepID=A0AB40AJH4_DIOCR|nr:RCC1 domain-containing protein RUG3, mitochondrial isoform X1 [Dioscorea cayenensis subsp. rotundata]
MAVALLRSRIHGRILRPYSTQPSLLWSPAADDPHSPASTLQIFSWGHGGSGQLGGGKEELRHYPTSLAALRLPPDFRLSPVPGRVPFPPPPTGSMEVGISCGLFHSALLVNGMLWIWGKGDGGRLGFGDEVSGFVPKLNPNLSDVKSVALGGIHSTALTASGDVFTWGYGGFGALGHSVYHRELLPRLVHGSWSGKISHLATSGAHTAAITESGELYTWGRDEGEGRLGLGSGGGPGEGGSFSIPSKVNALPVPVAAAKCGGFFTMALTSDGQVWNWGANSNYELGRGDNKSDWRPQLIRSLQDARIIQVACGGYHSLALTDKGEVFSWGHGGQGQLGHGSRQNEKVPLVIEALAHKRITYIACGGSSSAAVADDGKLFMWGNSRDCQLGVPGLPDSQLLPVEVQFLTEDEELGPHNVISVALGASHTMCLVSRQ